MSSQQLMTERLISEFTGKYMEKLYYFCLRKTGSIYEAEDLAQDITLNVIYSLKKGHIPESLSAWVWKIARNRYYLWVKKKHISRDCIDYENATDIDIDDGEMNAEERYILNEDISFLRRELAFISKEYRDIVVAYYIDDKKLKDIASSINLPEGTVKSKLFYARKKLKEGMNMAREFGKRSYKPEDVWFAANGSQPSGLPWKAVQRKIPKNILLEASNNPSTLEELSVELGIALPYIEEEADILERATLLKKEGDKYITNFFIQSKECQMDMYFAMKKHMEELARCVNNIVSDSFDKIHKLGIVKNNMNNNELKWWVVLFLVNHCILNVKGINLDFPVKREDSRETWGFTGYEQATIPECYGVGMNGVYFENIRLYHFKLPMGDMWNKIPESYDYRDAILLKEATIEGKSIDTLSPDEKNTWKRIENRFAHADEDGNIIPDIVVVANGNEKKIRDIFYEHKDYRELAEVCQRIFSEIIDILRKESNPILHNQLEYNASNEIFSLRGLIVNELIRMKEITIPEKPEKTTIGVSLHIY